jgi:hypothetical protein
MCDDRVNVPPRMSAWLFSRSFTCGLALLMAVTLITIPMVASAAPPDRAAIRAAKKLAKKARRLAKRGEWGAAAAMLAEAEKKHPSWTYAAALAAGYRDAGNLIIAWEAERRARKYGVSEKNQAGADALRDDIEKRLLADHAFLELVVVPSDARVRVNGEQWRPPYQRWVKGSLSKLAFEHGDYIDMGVTWHHPAGHKAKKSVQMISKSSYGRIEVEGYPSGAIVFVEDKELGTLPKARTGLLAPGTYKVRVELAEFDVQHHEVVVRSGTPTKVAIRLEESESAAVKLLKSRRFWGWTGVGIGAAALGASIGLLVHASAIEDDMLNLNKTHVSGYASYVREYDALDSDLSTFSTAGYALLGVGLALGGAGATLLALDYSDEESSAFAAPAPPTWLVTPTPRGIDALVRF